MNYPEDNQQFMKKSYYYDPLIFFDKDSLKPRLDLYIEIPAENILFKLNEGNRKYESFITIIVNIENKTGKPVLNKYYENNLSYSKDEMVKFSKEPKFYLYNYFLEPGDYKLEIRIKDANSGNDFTKSSGIIVKDFSSDEITISDIMLLSQYKISETGTKEITPIISRNIYNLRDFYIFFELYNRNDIIVNKEYLCRIMDSDNKLLKEETFFYTLPPGINKEFENISLTAQLIKYEPEGPDFDLYLFDREEPIYFKLELIEKQENKVVAEKKLNFNPGKRQNMEMHRTPGR